MSKSKTSRSATKGYALTTQLRDSVKLVQLDKSIAALEAQHRAEGCGLDCICDGSEADKSACPSFKSGSNCLVCNEIDLQVERRYDLLDKYGIA